MEIAKSDEVQLQNEKFFSLIVKGDLAKLTDNEKTEYYVRLCKSLGLNSTTRPFEYIVMNGKMVLYARKDATDQLRSMYGISIQIISRENLDGVYVVTARAFNKSGRQDESIGAVSIKGFSGDVLANAVMKAETKAKRRVTLSICGLGILDETETETIPNVKIIEEKREGDDLVSRIRDLVRLLTNNFLDRDKTSKIFKDDLKEEP